MPSKTRRGKFIPSAPLKSVGETIGALDANG